MSSISKDINRGLTGASTTPITRVPARQIEAAVRYALRQLLLNERQLAKLFDDGDTATTRRSLATAAELARHMGPHAIDGAHALLVRLKCALTVHGNRVEASVAHHALHSALDHHATTANDNDRRIALMVITDIAHRKRGARLVIAGPPAAEKTPDTKLVALLAKAHQARAALFANATPRGNRHIERMARLAYLAPDITSAILDGTQPATLTSRSRLKIPGLPLGWADQRKMLGFA